MNVKALKPAVDVNPEPEIMLASPIEACPVSSNHAQLADSAPMGARSLALTIVATIAVVFALQWAENFFIPLLLGIIIAYTLNPLVVWMERAKIPRVIGTIIVMLSVLCGSAFVTISLARPDTDHPRSVARCGEPIVCFAPQYAGGQPTTMQKVQAAAQEIDKATSQAADVPSTPKQSANHVVIDQLTFQLGDYLRAGSMGLFGFVSQATMVLLLVFFLLLAGDTFKRRLIRLTGPSLLDKKITVHILDDINVSIQRYMFTMLMANVLLTLLTWVAFWWIGLENAGGWAIAAGVLHSSRWRQACWVSCSLSLSQWRCWCRGARWRSLPSSV